MLDFTFHIHNSLGESQMADLQAKLDEIKATIEAEKAEVAGEIAALGAKIDELKAAVEAGQTDNAAVAAGLDEIKAGIENIFTPPAAP